MKRIFLHTFKQSQYINKNETNCDIEYEEHWFICCVLNSCTHKLPLWEGEEKERGRNTMKSDMSDRFGFFSLLCGAYKESN